MTDQTCFCRYRRYKDDTSRVEKYLADTTKPFFNKRAWTTMLQEPDQNGTRRLKPRHFLTLANRIALADIKTPAETLYDLREAIKLRKRHGSFFANVEVLREANKGHTYFNSVLEETYMVLRSTFNDTKEGRRLGENLHQETEIERDLKNWNPFSHLAGEDVNSLVDAEDPGPTAQSQASCPTTDPDTPGATLNPEAEFLFALQCFLEDAAEIRTAVRGFWELYKARKMTLSSAALLTNTASDLLQRCFTEFLLDTEDYLPNLSFSNEKVLPTIMKNFARLCDERRVGTELRPHRKAVQPPSLFAIAEENFIPALDVFFKHIKKIGKKDEKYAYFLKKASPLPEYDVWLKGKKFKVGPASGESSGVIESVVEWEHSISIAPLLFREYYRLSQVCDCTERTGFFLPDGLTISLANSLRKDADFQWLPLGFQIILDIHNVLKGDIARPLTELHLLCESTQKTITEYMALKSSAGLSPEFAVHDGTWKHISQNAQNLRIDLVADTYAKALQLSSNNGGPKKNDGQQRQTPISASAVRTTRDGPPASELEPPPPHFLLKNNPAFSGLNAYGISQFNQLYGLRLTLDNGHIVLCAIHIYSALRLKNLLAVRWEDAEFLIGFHGRERVFIGEEPQDIPAYCRRQRLLLGYSATHFARNSRRNRGSDISQAAFEKRGITETKLTALFDQHFNHDKGNNWEVTSRNILAYLADHVRSTKDAAGPQSDSGKVGTPVSRRTAEVDGEAEVKSNETSTPRTEKMRQGKGKSRGNRVKGQENAPSRGQRNSASSLNPDLAYQPRPAELLRALAGLLEKEQVHHYFSYLSMSTRCIKFLLEVRNIMIKYSLSPVESFFLLTADFFDVWEAHPHTSRQMLQEIAGLLKGIIEKEGRMELERAERLGAVELPV